MATQPEVTELAEHVRAVVAAAEAGVLPAGPDQLAYLRGALDVLRVMSQCHGCETDTADSHE